MKKKRLKILLGILSVVFFCWGCRALANFLDPVGIKGRPDEVVLRDEYYAMDSQTILADVIKNKPVQLNLVPEPAEILPSAPPVVPWTQADYLQIANAVFFTVWKDSAVNWKLDEIYAETNCAGIGLGFQTMSFDFFRVKRSADGYFHTQRRIYINPEKKLIWVLETKTSPVRSWGWGAIDADKIIPAEEALKIAEENGGSQARYNNIIECDIAVKISAGDNWRVSYWQALYDRNQDFFFMEVDERTGQVVSKWSEPPAP
ncbi:MAG: hypothetical protein Fur0043_16010 [Anaerolineales bacterium]